MHSQADVVEDHTVVLNGMGTLLSNHVAQKDKLVRRFDLEALRQSQTCFVTDTGLRKSLEVKTSCYNLSFFAA